MNWRHYVRSQLPPLDVAAERESEIIEELAVQLESIYDRARARGETHEAAEHLALSEVTDWPAFAHSVTRIERRYIQTPAPGAGAGGLMTGLIQDLRYAI